MDGRQHFAHALLFSAAAGFFQGHWGVGTGVRLITPVGPMALDVAYGLKTKAIRLHMTVGLVCEMTDKSAERTRSTSVGCISLPSLAMAAATIAFCNGVTTVSPWPIDANASLSSLMSVGNFDVTDTHGVSV